MLEADRGGRRAVRLRPPGSSQQLDWTAGATGAPRWLHWGAPFAGAAPDLPEPLPASTVDGDPRADLCPVEGHGWMQSPALQGYRPGAAGNTGWTPHWGRCDITFEEDGACVVLEDETTGLRWRQRWRYLAGADLWAVDTELENLAGTPYQLCWMAAVTLPLPAHASRALSLGGPWAGEFREHWDRLPRGLWRLDNRRGRTSHDRFPGLMLGGDELGEGHGEGWAVHLAFSGNHSMLVDLLTDGRRQVQLGELLQPGEGLMAPGAVYRAPRAYAAYSARGLGGLSAAFHAALRHHVLPSAPAPMRPRPVHLNTWEAMYFRHDPRQVAELARLAAGVGVERFVLDDGWFHRREHDRAGLGDWWPDAAKYPNGLETLARLVTDLGMEFGLWVEPEMVNPDSDLFRAHPDWVLAEPGRPPVLGRNQLVLDISRQAVSDYLFGCLDALLARLPVRYLKWDMNRDLAPAGAGGHPVAGAQVRALYALLARLRAAHPGVEIESCASGGGRADFGILAFTERIWTSDCNDPFERTAIQRGFQRFFPPEIMGAHAGPAPAHTTGRHHRLDFRAAVALCGHFGIEADLGAMAPVERDRLAAWIALHKRLRGRVHGAAVHQGSGVDGTSWTGYWHAARGQGLLCVWRHAAAGQRYPERLRLAWLDGLPELLVRASTPNDTPLPHDWQSLETGMRCSGTQLATLGLQLPPMLPESAWIVELDFP